MHAGNQTLVDMTEPKREKPEEQKAAGSISSKWSMNSVRSSSFKYYIHDSIEGYRFQLFGELTEADVSELEGCWRTARTTLGNRKLVIDLRGLKTADDSGKRWLLSMASEGASYLPDSFLRNGLVAQPGAAKIKSPRRFGVLGKILSVLKGIETEPTQAQ